MNPTNEKPAANGLNTDNKIHSNTMGMQKQLESTQYAKSIHIIPVPEDAGFMDYKLDGRIPDIAYPYYNSNRKLMGYTGRWNKPNGKDIRPITFCQMPNGERKWISQAMPEPRPLYNLLEIIQFPDKPVLICEGEKTAEAGKILFPDYVVTTTMQGAQSPHKTDFLPLKERNVVIAMDHDDAGLGYGKKLVQLCKEIGVRSVMILNPEMFKQYCIKDGRMLERQGVLSKGYDLADALEEGWTLEFINQYGEYGDIYLEPNVLFGCIDDIEQVVITEWPDLKAIKAELLPVEPLPMEIIPEPLQAWIKDIAFRMQCPIDHMAIPAIIMIGSVIGAGCGVRPKRNDDWQVIPNLWGGIVGKPGSSKSPALSEVLKPLNILAQEAMEEFKAKKKDYECDVEIYKCQKESIISEAKKALKGSPKGEIPNAKQQLLKLEEPNVHTWRRFIVNDPTIEKMSELLSQNSRGLLLHRDELIGLLATWDKEGHETDRSFYLESWNGYGSYITDRIGRGTVYCQNMCVSVLGSTQPSKLIGYLHRAIGGIENDGLIQRFQLLVYPDEITNWKLTDQKPDLKAQQRAYAIVKKLANMDFALYGGIKQSEKDIPYFHFDNEAQEMFYEWLTDLQTKLADTDNPDIVTEHLSKYRKLMPALSLIFHLIGIADGKASGPITLEAAEKAAAWCGYLELHARRIYSLGLNRRTQGAKALCKKLKKKELNNPFTVRDVYRKEWSYLNKVEDAQNACEELVDLGWLRETIIPPQKGQKGKTQYHINPKVWGEDE